MRWSKELKIKGFVENQRIVKSWKRVSGSIFVSGKEIWLITRFKYTEDRVKRLEVAQDGLGIKKKDIVGLCTIKVIWIMRGIDMAILKTKRLILRPLLTKDLDDVFKYSSTPNVGPNAGWKPHESKEETLEIMKAIFLNKETVWGIEEKETERIIGSIGLIDDPKRECDMVKMIGYAIGEAYWGKGFMTEAVNDVIKFGFEELHLLAISAYCFPFNIRSKNILKKCNFDYEGTLKMAEKIFNGNIYDNDCYLLTKQRYYFK